MIDKYCQEEQSRIDKERAQLVDAGIILDEKYGSTRALAFMLESGIPDGVIERVLRKLGQRRVTDIQQ